MEPLSEPGDPFAEAGAAYLEGRYGDADRILDDILRANPEHADALNLKGVLANRSGAAVEALEAFRRAIAVTPDNALYNYNFAGTLATLGRFAEADVHYTRAIESRQGNAELMNARAYCRFRLKRFEEAIADATIALAVEPNHLDALLNLGAALLNLRRAAKAATAFARATELAPTDARGYHQLGLALQELDEHASAIRAFERALSSAGATSDSYIHLGVSLHALRCYEKAIAAANSAIEMDPTQAVAYSNKALALHQLFRDAEALRWFDAAIARAPNNAQAYADRGYSKSCLGTLDDAIADYRASLELNPERALTHVNLAVALLRKGEFREGWREFEWRWRLPAAYIAPRNYELPALNYLDEARDRTILVHAEQGFGDTLQFCRYLPSLAARGARVVFDVPAPLVPLMRGVSGVHETIETGSSPPPFDAHIGLMGLPRLFNTEPSTIPWTGPYLSPPEERFSKWRKLMPATERLRIGIAWQGRPTHLRDRQRSVPFPAFRKLFVDGVEFHALQPDIAPLDDDRVIAHGGRIADFADTAALCHLLDLVVTVDTSVAHLAGAMGKPVWLLLPFVPDWRWMLGRSDSPWYPSMRLFRQSRLDDWDEPLARIRAELLALST